MREAEQAEQRMREAEQAEQRMREAESLAGPGAKVGDLINFNNTC